MSTTQKRNIPWGALGPWLALAVTCLFFSTQSDRFLSGENLSLVLQQVMVVGVLAIGQSLIILTAGIDLSCGMVMALGGVVMTKFAVNYGMDPYAAIVCGLTVTTGFGLINGLLVTRLRLPPFIVTLGTLNIAFAITQIYSESQTITNLPAAMTTLGNTFNLGSTEVSLGTVTMLFLYALAWFVLRETAPGRHLYAVGNNPEAARLTGINVDRVLLWLASFMALRPCCRWRAPAWATPTPGKPKTWTRLPRWCWVAPACLAVAALFWAHWWAR